VARQDRLCAIAILAMVLVSGCGARTTAAGESPRLTSTTTQSPPSTSSSVPPPRLTGDSSAPPDQDNPCTADMLTGSVEPKASDAGSRHVTLVVRNKSQQACSLFGYGQLDLLDIDKNSLPTNAERNLKPESALVVLAPGASAAKTLRWSVVAAEDEPADGKCATSASSIRVIPPDENAPFEVAFEFGPVCDHGRLETSAYYPK
jgi:hypothetical protein